MPIAIMLGRLTRCAALLALLVALLYLAAPASGERAASAGTIRVPQDEPTIQAAVDAGLSAVGYSGTNASGPLIIRNSVWDRNGAGIVPNTFANEKEPPQGGVFIYGNVVTGTGQARVPINTPLAGFYGIGIAIAGGNGNGVVRNTITGSTRYGVAVFTTA